MQAGWERDHQRCRIGIGRHSSCVLLPEIVPVFRGVFRGTTYVAIFLCTLLWEISSDNKKSKERYDWKRLMCSVSYRLGDGTCRVGLSADRARTDL